MPGLGVARISRLAISIVLIALGVTQTAPAEVNAAGESWFNDSWQFRKAITIDATKVSSGPHTDFPVLVNLSSDASLAANAQADGDDILFTSSGGATQLSHEIETYTSGGTLTAWVKVPSLPSSTDTVLFMYYGNGSATSQQNATGVWDANYAAVYHLKENPAVAGANGIIDSTSNANHGTDNNTVGTVTGQIDGSLNFTGAGYVQAPSSTSLNIGGTAITISFWASVTDTGGDSALLAKALAGPTAYQYAVEFDGNGANTFDFYFGDTGGVLRGPFTTLPTAGVLQYGVFTYDGANVKRYLNGVQTGTTTATQSIGTSTNPFRLGGDYNTIPGQLYTGKLDEVRVSNVARAAGWITTEFNNQGTPTTFYAVGTATVQQPTVTTGSATNVTTSSATLNGTVNALARQQRRSSSLG